MNIIQLSPFKYNINNLLDRLPSKERTIALQQIPAAIETSMTNFNRWRGFKKGDIRQIPADKLLMIARYFGVTINEMFDFEISTPTHQEMMLRNQKQIAAQYGLSIKA